MFRIVRTVFGLVVGWVVSAIMGLLGRYHSQGSLTVRPDRRQFVRNATLGAVGTVLTLSAASLGLLLWPRKTGAFGSELTVKAEDVPTVEGQPFHNIQGKFCTPSVRTWAAACRMWVRSTAPRPSSAPATAPCTTMTGFGPVARRLARWTSWP